MPGDGFFRQQKRRRSRVCACVRRAWSPVAIAPPQARAIVLIAFAGIAANGW